MKGKVLTVALTKEISNPGHEREAPCFVKTLCTLPATAKSPGVGGCYDQQYPCIYIPWGVVSFGIRMIHTMSEITSRHLEPSVLSAVVDQKTRFAVFLQSHTKGFGIVRAAFCDLLAEIDEVDSIGKAVCGQGARDPELMNARVAVKDATEASFRELERKIYGGKAEMGYDTTAVLYEPYKFVITFEVSVDVGDSVFCLLC
jgi:hypothetical protein